jgi:trigger factor
VKSSVETVDPTRVRLTVEVPFEELKPSLDAAYRRIAAQVTIPGFRKGKVPAAIIDQRIGRGAVLEEAVNEELPKAYDAAVREHGLRPLGQPDVDVTGFADGAALAFTAEVDVRPEFELPDYHGLAVTVPDAEVTDAEVQEQVDGLRGRFASLTTVERAAETGDFVTLDLAASRDGTPIEDATATGLSYEIGSGDLLEGLDEAITGLSAGESATFTAALRGGEHEGVEADVQATVSAVRIRNLPEADDDFAQLASEFDTLEELADDLRTRLVDYKKLEQGIQARDRVLDALLEQVDLPLPERLVQAQVDDHFDDGHGDTAHREEVVEQTRKALKAQFVLDAVAANEELQVGEGELTEYLVRQAPRYGLSPEQFAQELVGAGQVPAVLGEVVRAKALAVVLGAAVVTDESGRPVDLEALGLGAPPRPEPGEPAEQATETAAEPAEPEQV